MDIKAFAIVAVFIAIFMNYEVEARPQQNNLWDAYYSRYPNEERRTQNECQTNDEVNKLCQRCAKVTKSRLAFPMCCEMRENTRTWCSKFLNFGLSTDNNQI